MTSQSLRTLTIIAALSACVPEGAAPPPPGQVRLESEELGVSLAVPAGYQLDDDPVLFDSHGFFVRSSTDAEDVLARVAHAWKATDIEALVADKLQMYADVHPMRIDFTLPDGRSAVAVTGLPGTRPYTVVYTSDGDRVFEIGLWSDHEGLDDTQRALLGTLAFRAPTADRTATLRLAADALYDEPPADLAPALHEEEVAHAAAFEAAAAEEPDLRAAIDTDVVEAPVADEAFAATCSFTAPASLYWQLQWDRTNRFYSGAVYNLRDEPGWSAMSGNGGSWWGHNYHVGKCWSQYNNQFFANDWPTQNWGNAYAAFGGTIEWAGWGTDGYATLGRYVVVRHGGYRSLTAHLNGIRRGVRWGAHLDGYSQVVGWAGSTGGPWAPHIHGRVSWGESLTANGQPYGGQSVRPRRLRCFACDNPDVRATRGGYYTQFSHGRWMKY